MGIVDYFKLGIGAVVGGAVAILFCFLVVVPSAKEDARRDERAAQLQNTMKAIEQRSKTNEDVDNLADADLCKLLGGMYVNGVCQ